MLQHPVRTDYDILRDYWRTNSPWEDFEKGWRRSLHDGVVAGSNRSAVSVQCRFSEPPSSRHTAHKDSLEVSFRPDPCLWDGRFANNGWLQELPKPVSKLTWDNALLTSPATAAALGLSNHKLAKVSLEDGTCRLPSGFCRGRRTTA